MTMKPHTDLQETLCTDEAVCFIADRHNVTPQQLLSHFLAVESSPDGNAPAGAAITLEPNEVEILKGLSRLK